jgi:hypothetical protein
MRPALSNKALSYLLLVEAPKRCLPLFEDSKMLVKDILKNGANGVLKEYVELFN